MATRRILVVEDDRNVIRAIRAGLETLGRGFIIVETLSGEEAFLEIRRGGIDLLITDVRLPGMSGLDVVKRLRQHDDKAQAIVISGQPQFEAEARKMGVAFFNKPLQLDTFLKAVLTALGEKDAPAVVSQQPEEPGIADRLSTLRRDLGANAVCLVDLDGKVVVRAGDVVQLDLEPVLTHLMTAFSAAMKVCRLLGGFIPSNVHFFDGDDFDVYAANVGQFFALVIIFDGDRGAGQMGPVMRYGRQCADDLLNSLVMMGVTEEPAPPPLFVTASTPVTTPPPAKAMPTAAPAPAPSPARAAPQPQAAPVVAAAPAAPPPPPPKPLTEAELKALEAALSQTKSVDADSFWDTALAEAEEESIRADALSWDQAEKLGLLPKK
jgi:CheY-like chemotaxis protein/predicted regulator of Ras-like GTPase activity (Roadblock/LC7/MglB family)